MLNSLSKQHLVCAIALSCLLMFFQSSRAYAQNEGSIRYCGQWKMEQAFLNAHPEQRAIAEQADARLEWETQNFEDSNRDELIVIPVVFHVIHYNGPENVSDEQLFSGIEVMNRDYRLLNDDSDDIIEEFEDIAADTEIEFRLAQIDPQGNCHTGINRLVSPLTYDGGGEIKDLIQWPRNSYLNIWVVENASGAAGYSLYPGSVNGAQGAGSDGIVVAHDYTGNIGTSNNYRSRTLTHEAGHWMNLRHLWGNSNSPGDPDNCDTDDQVADTPTTSGWTSCNVNGSTCGSLDNVQNYMEYSYCGRMFSDGQRTRMRAAMNSGTAQRNQLWTPQNLEDTGVNLEPILCEARFGSTRQTICVGDTIQFFDNSYHGGTNWEWSFGDGNAASDENPVHAFDLPGLYDVTLTVSNGTNEVTTTEISYIQVLNSNGMTLPFTENFEAEELDENWFMVDVSNDGDGWEISSAAGYTGDQSLRILNWSNDSEFNRDQLVSKSIDMSEAELIQVTYKWAYSYKGNDEDEDATDDRLKVYASPDCGTTWSLRRMHRGLTDLPSAPPHPFLFTPNGQDEWNSYVLNIPYAQFYTENFRLMFEFESRLGNNIFLDDINITAYTTSDLLDMELGEGVEFEVYPNPARNQATVSFSTRLQYSEMNVELRDLTGRKLWSDLQLAVSPGRHQIDLPTAQWSAGTYLVSVILDGRRFSKQLVIQ
ncbi:zinc-dependent metalloprotease [Flavobacteriales bacterium]|nr:zinc-dependent metalloprotease [Flavobacteriales bacterium]